eukprot:5801566-Pyramimonas_sp.AAC.1
MLGYVPLREAMPSAEAVIGSASVPRRAMPGYALISKALLCNVVLGAAVRCHALICKASRCNSSLRHRGDALRCQVFCMQPAGAHA